eukprot:TRINITY_DN1694_c0_g2_i6.p1 TRINITY_DN1694_c0_g2~~TRINITY_DN1694_c0_g2_i6.p1  ORF type:complete len:345 (+),score=63.97 TRINITY_DN1694_c0_g2_i6:93-1127(+)
MNTPLFPYRIDLNVLSGIPGIRTVVIHFVPEFSGLSPDSDEIVVTPIGGGITNALFKCAYGEQLAVVRVFGEKTELVIDREREGFVSEYLGSHGFGTQIYGRFENGRVEKFLYGKSLSPDEMLVPETANRIAVRLAQLHAMEVPISKDLTLWGLLDEWLQIASSITFEDPAKNQQLTALNLPNIGQELRQLREILEQKFPGTVVFCHNDLLSGNVMLDNHNIDFIDFEYSFYNYREFDIANHFCECCGFNCDWSQFPDEPKQKTFLACYLAESLHLPSPDAVPAATTDSLYSNMQPWCLMPHLFWGIWAIVQSRYSPIDFDYLSYSKLRLDGYFMMKHTLLKLE